jgi:hypothetical protein
VIEEWGDERTEGVGFDRKELARDSGRSRLNCPCNISELAASVSVVDIVEADHLLVLVPSETVPETVVPTVVSESLLDRENWSAMEGVDGIRNA